MRILFSMLRFERVVAAAFLLGLGTLAAADDGSLSAAIGKWSLNAAKSRAEGTQLPKSYTVEITDAGGGKTRSRSTWVGADGTHLEMEWTADLSGEPAPFSGDPEIDAVSAKSKGPRTTEVRYLKNGKQVESGRYTVSADGRTMRAIESGTEQGKKWRVHLLFDKQ